MALSTLRPATSPHLSVVKLNFVGPPSGIRSPDTLTGEIGDDLRRVADEVTRIKREFGEAMSFDVFRDPWFKVALDAVNVSKVTFLWSERRLVIC